LRASSRIVATFMRVAIDSGARAPSPPSGGGGAQPHEQVTQVQAMQERDA
jgi:hypothetical protein